MFCFAFVHENMCIAGLWIFVDALLPAPLGLIVVVSDVEGMVFVFAKILTETSAAQKSPVARAHCDDTS